MTNADKPAAVDRPSAPWNAEKVLFNVPAVVALLADHDRRVADLLEANNRYQQGARDARTEGKKLFDAMRLMGEYAVKLSEAGIAEKKRADAAEIAAAAADASWRETLRKERDARLHVTRLKEAGRVKADWLQDKVDGLQSDLDSALDVLGRRIIGEADLPSAFEWLLLNYPDRARQLIVRRLQPFVGTPITPDQIAVLAESLRQMIGDGAFAIDENGAVVIDGLEWPIDAPQSIARPRFGPDGQLPDDFAPPAEPTGFTSGEQLIGSYYADDGDHGHA